MFGPSANSDQYRERILKSKQCAQVLSFKPGHKYLV